MAAARPHVDSSINERRLRPIYDCLDNGNNKKAIQEADKVLKKQKDFQCAKVLKALALLRTGKQDDSLRLLQEVHSEVPTDDGTLQAMTICYRELHRLDMIAEIYKAAILKDPQNEELLTHLFMAYVRLGEYKKQQQVALNLYKLKAKNPYYFWGVMSIVMQAHDTTQEMAQNMLLPLAERMTEKFVRDNKIEAEAEVQLYLLILELEHKYQEALEVLEGPLGEKLTSFLNFKSTKKAELLYKLERWPEVNAEYKALIYKNPDNWLYYCEYLASTMRLVESGYQPATDGSQRRIDYTVQMAQNFLLPLVEMEKRKQSKAMRGPFLAYVKLVCLSLKHASGFGTQELLVDLLRDYYQRFGDKACCFGDTMNLFSYVEDSEKPKLLAAIKTTMNLKKAENGIELAEDAKQMQRHLNYVQLCRYLGSHAHMSASERLLLVDELLQQYEHGRDFGENLLTTDVRPNDGYSILVAHILIEIWRETGAVGPTYTLYESMDIKHIQQDVLGYLVTPHMAAKGHFAHACIIYGNMLKFFTTNYKDTVDYLIASYKFGSFTKIQEFVEFRERLNNSLQYAMVAVERLIQDLILETNSHVALEQVIIYMEIDPEKDKTIWENLRGNWDLDIMISWDPPSKQVSNSTKQLAFDAEVEWLKLRNLLVRCVAAAHGLSTSPSVETHEQLDHCNGTNGEKRPPWEVLADLAKQLQDIVKGVKPETYQLPADPIQGPLTSRIVGHLRGGYFNPIIELLNLTLKLHQMPDHISDTNDEKCDFIIKSRITKEIKDCISRVISSLTVNNLSNLSKMADILDDLVNVSEMLSFVAILLGFCYQIVKPAKTKKGRKKKETTRSHAPAIVEDFNQLVIEVENVIIQLQTSIRDVQIQSIVSQTDGILLEDKHELLAQDVEKKIEKSYQQSLIEVDDLLQNKLKYLSPLRL